MTFRSRGVCPGCLDYDNPATRFDFVRCPGCLDSANLATRFDFVRCCWTLWWHTLREVDRSIGLGYRYDVGDYLPWQFDATNRTVPTLAYVTDVPGPVLREDVC